MGQAVETGELAKDKRPKGTPHLMVAFASSPDAAGQGLSKRMRRNTFDHGVSIRDATVPSIGRTYHRE